MNGRTHVIRSETDTATPETITRPSGLPDLDAQPTHFGGDEGWIVVVYNNEHNTYDQVIEILMRATACTAEEAAIETWEVDHLGQSVVHHGRQEECDRAAVVIRTIGIHVEVKQE